MSYHDLWPMGTNNQHNTHPLKPTWPFFYHPYGPQGTPYLKTQTPTPQIDTTKLPMVSTKPTYMWVCYHVYTGGADFRSNCRYPPLRLCSKVEKNPKVALQIPHDIRASIVNTVTSRPLLQGNIISATPKWWNLWNSTKISVTTEHHIECSSKTEECYNTTDVMASLKNVKTVYVVANLYTRPLFQSDYLNQKQFIYKAPRRLTTLCYGLHYTASRCTRLLNFSCRRQFSQPRQEPKKQCHGIFSTHNYHIHRDLYWDLPLSPCVYAGYSLPMHLNDLPTNNEPRTTSYDCRGQASSRDGF